MKTRIALAVLAVAISAGTGTAIANSTGYWHAARPESGSCGNCHGLAEGTGPVPLLVLHGLPESYGPGQDYDLTVMVLGPVLPLAGFNLEVNGGTLVALPSDVPVIGGVAQVNFLVSECAALQQQTGCSGGACQVRTDGNCSVYGPHARDCACAPEDLGDSSLCRACSTTTIVSAQAAHASPALVPSWKVRWRTPACSFGDAVFHLAGNSVNGNDVNDEADVWGVLPAPLIVPPGCAP